MPRMTEFKKIFAQRPEDGASRHLITAEDHNLVKAADGLVEQGLVVGQAEMMSQDVIYYLNPELSPRVTFDPKAEHLKRPTLTQIRKDGHTLRDKLAHFKTDEEKIDFVRQRIQEVTTL